MTKITISTPAYGEMFYAPYVRSLFQRTWSSANGPRRLPAAPTRTSSKAAIFFTRWFDKTDASHLLFLDADMGFDPQLIVDMIAFDQPLTGAAYPKREIDQIGSSSSPVRARRRRQRSRARTTSICAAQRRAAHPTATVSLRSTAAAPESADQAGRIAEMLEKLPELSDAKAKKTAPKQRISTG